MAAIVRTGFSVLRYRGGAGQWAWAVHRVAGLGVLAFLLLHIFDIFLVSFGPQAFNDLIFLYKGPAARVLEILLLFGLLYHALNGLRLIAGDFAPSLASRRIARNLFYVQLVVFSIVFVPAGYLMMTSLPHEPFNNNAIIALVVTLGILAFPLIVAAVASLTPTSVNTRIDTDSTKGNYDDAIARIVASRKHRVMNRRELNIWLFMRVSGFFLIFLALLHFALMHFVYGVEGMDFDFIVFRWMDPVTGWFWRTYDLALLFFALTHGLLGARYSVEDYIHNRPLRYLLLGGMLLIWLALTGMGLYATLTFNVTGG